LLYLQQNHLDNPQNYSPLDPSKTDNSQNGEQYIRFTVDHLKNPICSISQEHYKIDDIIAICNQCFSSFLARTLWKNFLLTNRHVCPICNSNLQTKGFNLPELEKTRMLIDLINEQISKFETNLINSRNALKQLKESKKVQMITCSNI